MVLIKELSSWEETSQSSTQKYHIYYEKYIYRERGWHDKWKLEQLERLRSEDTPRCLTITHTIESYWIPSQKKTKSKLQI